MRKVIFKKNDKVITIPFFIYEKKSKINGLYEKVNDRRISIEFNEEVTEIIFDNCNFYRPIYFDLLDHQRLVLNECNSYVFLLSSINVHGGNLDVHNSNFDCGSLYVKDCNYVLLDSSNTIGDYKIGGMSVEASDVVMTGDFDSSYYSVSIKSKNLDISNASILAQSLEIVSSNVNIEDSNLGYFGYFHCDYDNIKMNNVRFVSESGKLEFTTPLSNEKNDAKTKYFRIGSLTDLDVFSDKNNKIYSVISILKSYRDHISEINKMEIEKISKQINSQYSTDINEINKKLELLTIEKNKMFEEISHKVDSATNDISNRKIKQIIYPQK